jgi:hypothetical protein
LANLGVVFDIDVPAQNNKSSFADADYINMFVERPFATNRSRYDDVLALGLYLQKLITTPEP